MARRPNSMLAALAWASRGARRQADVARWEVAALAGVDVATVSRFERAKAWPRDPDELVAAYAALAKVRPQEIWRAAVNAWNHNGGS
ncbi:MAG: hypothetical protein JWM93_2677 [Frankiales bacterium]|nr:hypothetical protein [Frankiales bacterium]